MNFCLRKFTKLGRAKNPMKILIETEDNSIEHVVRNMLEREYHFEITTAIAVCLIGFRKGIWDIELNKEDLVQIDDVPEVLFQKIEHSLAEEYISARIQWHSSHTFETIPSRTIPCIAIYDFLKLRMGLESMETASIKVLKSHR
jgi:hypothetical protein